MTERLDRLLAQGGALTRSQARLAIRGGEVEVAGAVVRDPALMVAAGETVVWRDAVLARPRPRYLMLNKPAGYVCTRGDSHHPSALVLVDLPGREGLHFAGRLDFDTTGLVLITDDGTWSHRVTAPRRGCAKVYRVGLAEPVSGEAMAQLSEGVLLHGERRPTGPAFVTPVADCEVLLTIREGRYHQVKRMFAAVGNHVLRLHREAVGAIALDPELAPGEWRALTREEIESV